MERRYFFIIVIIILSSGFFFQAIGQNLETSLERYTGKNAGGYIQPLVTAFGANLNSGIYRNAHVPRKGLHIHFSLNAMMSIFSDEQRTFLASTEGLFQPPQQVETPTVVGDGEGAQVIGTGGTIFQFPGGYDLESFITASPMISISGMAGLELSARYFATKINEDIGNLSLYGFGLRHNINQYIPLFPVDMAAGIFYNNFKVGDIIEAKAFIIHAEVSKSFLLFDLYTGIGYESSKANINYTFDAFGQTQEISLDVRGENKFRTTVGLGFNLLIFHINADYNIGYQKLFNVGVSIGL